MNTRDDIIDSALSEIALSLKNIRLNKKISKNELSQLSSVSRPSITQVEDETGIPTLGTLFKLAFALGVSPKELLESHNFIPAKVNKKQVMDDLFVKLRNKAEKDESFLEVLDALIKMK
ncbi:MAG: helix-turn-helix domain-containing protein [Bacteroidota bacterium]